MRNELIIRGGVDFTCGHALPVAKDREAVGDLAHLFEEVTDVDHTDLLIPKLADQPKEMLHVVALQTAGRLVHQNDSRPRGDGAANLDYLSGGDRQVGDARLWTNLRMMKRAQHFCRACVELPSIKQA